MTDVERAATSSRRRILVVDDSALVRLYYRDTLQRAGFEVEQAINGIEAMEKVLAQPFDLVQLLTTVVGVANERHDDGVTVDLKFEGGRPVAFTVLGHDSRLGQVIDNLIDNARSFSPSGGTVRVVCRRLRSEIEIVVDDDGPGVPAEAVEKIFERFYTHRPDQDFGQNSGLGLSISKHII